MLTYEHCELYNYLCHLGCFQVFPDFVELVGVVGDPVHPPLHPQLPQLGDVLQHLVSSYLHCTYLHTAAPRCAVCGHVTGIFIYLSSVPAHLCGELVLQCIQPPQRVLELRSVLPRCFKPFTIANVNIILYDDQWPMVFELIA